MVYKIFIDDSGKKEYITPYSKDFIDNPPNFDDYEDFWRDNYFVLCGVRVKQENISEINIKINELKKKYFKTHKVEVKSDWLRNPHQRKKQYLDKFKITAEQLNKFGEKFVDLIARYKEEIKIMAVVFDKRYYGVKKRDMAEGTPLLKTTQVLLERLEFAGNYNILIFDQMESSLRLTIGQHGRILKVLQRNEGMEKIYVNKYDSVTDIKFMESWAENFLQVADVCAYNVFRQFVQFGREWEGKSKLSLYPYFNRIRCNFFFNPKNCHVRGCGLVCVPDKNKVNWNLLKGCFEIKKAPQK